MLQVEQAVHGVSRQRVGRQMRYGDRAGGAYQFGYHLISPVVGFLAGWLFILVALAAGATCALTFAAYLKPLAPLLSPRVLGLLCVIVATLLNVVGVHASARER